MWKAQELPSLIVCASWMLEFLILGIVWSRRRDGGRFMLDLRFALGLKLIFVCATVMYLLFSASQHVVPLVYSDSDYAASPTLLVSDMRHVRDDLARVQQLQVATIQYLGVQALMCLALLVARAKPAASTGGRGLERAVPSQPAR